MLLLLPQGVVGCLGQRDFGQDAIQDRKNHLNALRVDGQRGTDLEDIVLWPFTADQNAMVPHAVLHISTDLRRLRAIRIDQLNPKKQSHSAYITNAAVFSFQCFETGNQICTHKSGIFLQILVIHDIQNLLAHAAGQR